MAASIRSSHSRWPIYGRPDTPKSPRHSHSNRTTSGEPDTPKNPGHSHSNRTDLRGARHPESIAVSTRSGRLQLQGVTSRRRGLRYLDSGWHPNEDQDARLVRYI